LFKGIVTLKGEVIARAGVVFIQDDQETGRDVGQGDSCGLQQKTHENGPQRYYPAEEIVR